MNQWANWYIKYIKLWVFCTLKTSSNTIQISKILFLFAPLNPKPLPWPGPTGPQTPRLIFQKFYLLNVDKYDHVYIIINHWMLLSCIGLFLCSRDHFAALFDGSTILFLQSRIPLLYLFSLWCECNCYSFSLFSFVFPSRSSDFFLFFE